MHLSSRPARSHPPGLNLLSGVARFGLLLAHPELMKTALILAPVLACLQPRAVRVLGALSKASQQLQAYEVGREHRELLERHGNRLQPGVRARLQACVKMTEANYQDAKKVMHTRLAYAR